MAGSLVSVFALHFIVPAFEFGNNGIIGLFKFMGKVSYFSRVNLEFNILYYLDENSWKFIKPLTTNK